MYIETDRLFIRDFEFKDWLAVFDYTSDANVMRYIPEGILTEEETKVFICDNLTGAIEKFPVVLKDKNILIDHIDFHPYFGEHTYEIGWVFNPKYYNRGFATEAARAMLNYGFQELDIHRIIATCQPENSPSFRVMEKIGMTREGHFKKCIPHGKDWWDEYYYAILKEEFCI